MCTYFHRDKSEQTTINGEKTFLSQFPRPFTLSAIASSSSYRSRLVSRDDV